MNNPTLCPQCGHELTIEKTEFFITEACENCLQHWQIQSFDDCCRTPDYEKVRMVTSAGTIQVRSQCKNCGGTKGGALGGFTKEQREQLPEFNEVKRNTCNERRYSQSRSFYDRKTALFEQKKEVENKVWWDEYTAYLNSPQWQRKRLKVLQRDNYLCQACLVRPANEVHHKSYEFVKSEPCFDLVSICNECHQKLHEIRNKRKAS